MMTVIVFRLILIVATNTGAIVSPNNINSTPTIKKIGGLRNQREGARRQRVCGKQYKHQTYVAQTAQVYATNDIFMTMPFLYYPHMNITAATKQLQGARAFKSLIEFK